MLKSLKNIAQKVASFPLKIWKYILTLGFIPWIILGGVILFVAGLLYKYDFSFDNIIETKFTLEDTPTILKEVKDIGEIIGAEYYGEVIHSLTEYYADEDWQSMKATFDEVKSLYTVMYKNRSGRVFSETQRVYYSVDAFMEAHPTASNYDHQWFEAFMDISAFVMMEDRMLEAIRQNNWLQFQKKYFSELDRERREWRTKRNGEAVLIYLGRGMVKAGFNLNELDQQAFDLRGDTLLIHDLDPQILNADINPWLVPPFASDSGGIKGFEVLREEGTVSHQARNIVKEGCKYDLIQDAWKAGIMETAEETAEATLLNFYNLLADSTRQLSTVDILPTEIYEQHVNMFNDIRLDADEVKTIRSWMQSPNPPKEILRTIWIRAREGQHHASWYEIAAMLSRSGML